jgi:carbamate kinase
VLVAESQGQIGYLLGEAVDNEFANRRRRREVAVVLTRTLVDSADPAFDRPSKPVGPVYEEPVARRLAEAHGWTIAPDAHGWRRVVPSPRPLGLVEADTIRALADAGVMVVAVGGGGIPVSRSGSGVLRGVEAVVDKDLAAVLLAEAVDAEALLLLTDVPAVHLGWGSPDRVPIRVLTLEGAADGVRDGTFRPGSMGPKVSAAAQFVRRTGRFAAIGALEEAVAVLEGRSGTRFVGQALAGTGRPIGRRYAMPVRCD